MLKYFSDHFGHRKFYKLKHKQEKKISEVFFTEQTKFCWTSCTEDVTLDSVGTKLNLHDKFSVDRKNNMLWSSIQYSRRWNTPKEGRHELLILRSFYVLWMKNKRRRVKKRVGTCALYYTVSNYPSSFWYFLSIIRSSFIYSW